MADPVERLRQDIVFTEELRGRSLTFHSTWGLFNPRHVDPGSRLLIGQLAVAPDDVSIDLGCGYGPVGLTLACLCPGGQVHLVDKDFVAVEYARANARRNGLTNCHAYLSNGFSHVPDIPFDHVVSNLPAKVGNELLTLILHDARCHLKPGGSLWVVTIAGLKEYVKRSFRQIFGNYEKVKQGRAHIVARAVRE
ncbi:MAG: methyltransferase [Candidatus Latescibacterota bacterium]